MRFWPFMTWKYIANYLKFHLFAFNIGNCLLKAFQHNNSSVDLKLTTIVDKHGHIVSLQSRCHDLMIKILQMTCGIYGVYIHKFLMTILY